MAFFWSQNALKPFSAGDPPWTALGELTTFHQGPGPGLGCQGQGPGQGLHSQGPGQGPGFEYKDQDKDKDLGKCGHISVNIQGI